MYGGKFMRSDKAPGTSIPTFAIYILMLLANFTFSANVLADPQIIKPSTGSALSASAHTFTWSFDGADVERAWLYVGTYAGGRDIANSGELGKVSEYDVIGIPVNGSIIHARLWYYSDSRWHYVDSNFTTANLDVEVFTPAMESPASNSELVGTSVDFKWNNNNTQVNYWWLYLGTTEGGKDLYDSGKALRTRNSVTVDELPVDGSPIYARLWFRTVADGWKYADSMYRAKDDASDCGDTGGSTDGSDGGSTGGESGSGSPDKSDGGSDGGSTRGSADGGDDFKDIPLVSNITGVQPMTGIVLWANSHNGSLLKTANGYVQLEYAYVNPAKIVIGEGSYDWSSLEATLEAVRSRGKQMVLRLAYVFPGQTTNVPNYIKSLPDYNETSGISEGHQTYFPDWSNEAFQKAHYDLYAAFAARYDYDPRIAFLQVGFGLWSEYHIYEPGVELGVNFPSKEFQADFLNYISGIFESLQWSVSIDAAVESVSALEGSSPLMELNFGVFDDSFMHEDHGSYNLDMWNRFRYLRRYKTAVHGGEFSYYTSLDQQNVLNPEGIHGRSFADQSAKFHISYMIGNDQVNYQSNERIKEAGLNTGYRFKITSFQASPRESKVTVKNTGVAPIYYDAFMTVNDVPAASSLKGLLPGASAEFIIASGGANPILSIESERLVDGQQIEFEANL